VFKKFFSKSWPIFVIFLLVFVFFWKFFLKGLVPIPADVIVGIYYPWRDYIWNNLIAGVPFKNGLLSDVVSIIYPWRIYGIGLLKEGIWPLWIPHALSGTPLLANFQSGLFYPLNLLFLIFSNVNAWSIYIIFQPILASLFCYLFLKNLKLSNFASLIGSFIFAFSGFMIVWLEYGILGHSGLWLPLILLVINKLFEKPSFNWIVIGALAVSLSVLAGSAQISFLVFLVSLFYVIYKIIFYQKKDKIKIILYVFSFVLLGLSLSAVQLLPGFELWRFSIRQNDPTTIAFNFGLNPLKNLFLFLTPDFYGNPTTGNFWGWGAYNESACYVSVAGFLLAIIAFFNYRKDRTLNFFKILLVFSLLMAYKNPISSYLFGQHLPLLASSSAGRFFFLTDFSLAILAAFGLEFFWIKRRKLSSLFILIIVFIPFLILLAVVFLRPELWLGKDLMSNLIVAKKNLILPAIIFFSSLILLIALCLKTSSVFKKLIFTFLFLLIVFDLFRFGFKYTPFTDKNYLYPRTELTNFLKTQKGFYRFVGLIPQSMFIPYNLSSPEGYDALMTKRYSEFANQIDEEKFSQVSTGSRWVIVHRYESSLLNLLGVKYLLSFNSDPVGDWNHQYSKYPKEKYQLIFQHGKSQVYERKNVLPRAFIVHDFKVLTDEKILETLMNKDFDPLKTLLLEEQPQDLPKEKLGKDEVVINEDSYFDNQVLIKTNSFSDGFLFLSDTYYPGWKAFIDGQETKIYRANYNFRAVIVPTGEHQVVFKYEPQSFKIGVYLSGGTLLLILTGWIIFWKKKKL